MIGVHFVKQQRTPIAFSGQPKRSSPPTTLKVAGILPHKFLGNIKRTIHWPTPGDLTPVLRDLVSRFTVPQTQDTGSATTRTIILFFGIRDGGGQRRLVEVGIVPVAKTASHV
jgi:hypothetical protein